MTGNLSHKRIAKNTAYLYVRTIVITLISLFTSRVILRALGETDFGIYNLVGGLVVFFSFINSAMTSSTQRYLNVVIGRENNSAITHIFSTAFSIHILIAIIFLILSETIGLWFLSNKLNIPPDKEYTAFWVFQFTVLTTCLTIVRCPYNASIIAFEEMSFFARISVVEAVAKLCITFAVLKYSGQRLIFYSLLLFIVAIIINICYKLFCDRRFEYIRFKFHTNLNTIKSMLGFSIWTLMGSGSIVVSNQGIGVLLNISYNVIVNAALGLAYQVNTIANTLVSNFQTAFMPQITKSYVTNDWSYLRNLVYSTSRYSFFLVYIVSYPIFFNCSALLELWLGTYPEYTSGLVKIIILCVVFDALSGPLWMVVHARGNIRNYQLIVSAFLLSTMLLCYLAILLGYNPIVAYGTRIIAIFIMYIFRIFYVKRCICLTFISYFKLVLSKIIVIIFMSIILAILIGSNTGSSIINALIEFFIALNLVWFIGISPCERRMLISKIRNII